MKARIKGEKEWKDYKETFDGNGVFLGLETLGYKISEEEYCKRLGIEYDPESPFNDPCGHYMSKILPLECFDLVEDEKHLRTQAAIAAMQSLIASGELYDLCKLKEGETLAQNVANVAVQYADALIAELKKRE